MFVVSLQKIMQIESKIIKFYLCFFAGMQLIKIKQ